MPTRPLPEDPTLDRLSRQARRLHRAVRAADPGALALMREFHPARGSSFADCTLSDAQLATARSYGFSSWPALEQHLEAVGRFRWDPPAQTPQQRGSLSESDHLIQLACLSYGEWHPSWALRAERLLAENPLLGAAGIHAAAASGDVAAARALLERDRALSGRRGGPFGWEPLLYACYSRVSDFDGGHSTLEVARLLLAAGADPDAGFLWGGNVPPFTALTGAFGEGEDGVNQPPHPHRDALARLLLESGADPNDGQTLYNRHFNRSDDHLNLLLSYGLGRDRGGAWYRRLGERLADPARLLVEELWAAARMNFPRRVELLVEQGADVNARGSRDGRTPYEAALLAGNQEIAQYLLAHGARRIELSSEDALAVACVAGRRAEVEQMLRDDADLLQRLGPDGRVELLHRAVETGRLDGIRLMARLGFELSGVTTHRNVGMNRAVTPMHNAAWAGNLEMVRLLVDLGADPGVREAVYHATPLGWAAHNHQWQVVEYLLPFASVFDAVQCGAVERVAALLREDPSLAKSADDRGNPLVCYLHPGMRRLDEMLELLASHGADLGAADREGKTLLDRAVAGGQDDFASALRRYGPSNR